MIVLGSGEATGGLGGFKPPTFLQGHSCDLHRIDEKKFAVRGVQFELGAQNQQLIDRSPKTVKTAWAVFCELRLTDVYDHQVLVKLMKLAATLPVTSASVERVHSKLKLVKSALRSSLHIS